MVITIFEPFVFYTTILILAPKAMKYKADFLSIFLLLAGFALQFAFYFNFFRLPSFVGFIIVFLVYINRWGIFHNHLHLPFFIKKNWNIVMDILLMLGTGSPKSRTFIVHIVNHHPHSETVKDNTRTDATPKFRWQWLNLLSYPFFILPILIKGNRQYLQLKRWKKQHQKETAFLLIFSLFLAFLNFWNWVLFFLFPTMAAQYLLLFTNYLQHDRTDSAHPYNHSTNIYGWIYNWLTMNTGFHSIHHNRPALHWSLLPKAYKEVEHQIGKEYKYLSMWTLIWERYIRNEN